MREDGHGLLLVSRIEHHVNGEALARQVAAALCDYIGFTSEGQRCRCCHVIAILRTQHLEVINLAQVIASEGLRELNDDIVANSQNTVGRLWCTKGYRQTGILDTFQYLRRACQEAITIATVVDGTDVVVLLYGVNLAIEWSNDGTVGRNSVCHTAGLGTQRVVGIV